MATGRPFGVTLVAVIAWLTGAWQIIQGIFSILPGGMTVWAGIIAIVLGVVTILVSFGLFGGNNVARIIVAVVFVLNIAGSILLMFQHQFWNGVGGVILPLIGLALLFTARANSFFARS